MRRFILLSCFALALLLAVRCVASSTPVPTPQKEITYEEYVIGPEDVLEISVWQNQDLSRTVTVRPDGKIGMPLLNDVQAAGLTPEQLKEKLNASLKPYIDAPNVAVIVREINSWRVYVQGEVRTPGVYPLRSHTTISQAIAMAGGFTEFAKKTKIQVFRKWRGYTEIIEVNYSDILTKKAIEKDIDLKPGDSIIVP